MVSLRPSRAIEDRAEIAGTRRSMSGEPRLLASNRRTVGNTSVLSDEGRRLFCRSGLYGEEYAFLRRLGVPYELPSACAN